MPEGDTIHHAARRVGAALDRAGLPCRRCATLVRARGQGDDNRTTYWCPECQR